MRKGHEKRREGTSLLDTHLQLTPFYSANEGRFLALCFCGFHSGAIHPSAYFGSKSCVSGCRNIKIYYLPSNIPFDIENIDKSLSGDRLKNRNSPTLSMDFFRDEQNKRYAWVMDRGNRVYVARAKKLYLIPEIERTHFRLYI